MDGLPPQLQIALLAILGFFTGAAVAIEANFLVGAGIAAFSIIGAIIGILYYAERR